jgi:hypothetical protein
MKNIIKKILKEEIEDFGDLNWIQNQNPEPWEEFMFPYVNLEGKLGNTILGERIVYRDTNGEWIFYHKPNPKNGWVYFNYTKIWSVFQTQFGFSYKEIKELLEGWLGEHYNLRGVTARISQTEVLSKLGEHYNLRGVTAWSGKYTAMIPLGEHYNLRGVTARSKLSLRCHRLGEHYNLREETDDWDWVRDAEFTLAPGDLFDEDDICFNYGTDCMVNVDKDFIIFYLDFDDWVKMIAGSLDSDYYLRSLIDYGESVSNRYYSDSGYDNEEFNYSSNWMTDEQKNRLTELMTYINPNFNIEEAIDNNEMLSIGKMLEPFHVLGRSFDYLVTDFTSQIGENLERNRWINLYQYYKNILDSLEVELELYGNDLRIDIPMTTVVELNVNNLSDVLRKVSDKFLDEPWGDIFYEHWDSSGGEENVIGYFNTFLDSLEEFVLDDENLPKYKKFVEITEKMGFEYYQEWGFQKILALKNNEESFWTVEWVREDGDSTDDKSKVRLSLMGGNLDNYSSAEELESYIIPITEVPIYIKNYRLK